MTTTYLNKIESQLNRNKKTLERDKITKVDVKRAQEGDTANEHKK